MPRYARQVIWEPFILALFLGLVVSAGLYFAYLWPAVEPDDDAPDAQAPEVNEPEAKEPEPVEAAEEPVAETPAEATS
jgi:hypothetical protein